MTVRLNLAVPDRFVGSAPEWLDPAYVATLGPRAETSGFDAISVTDHPFPSVDWLAAGGHHALDPFVALSFLAASTTSIRLLTNVLVLPYRPAIPTAKAIATLDVLSRGRLIVGTAVGYLQPEFAAMGLDHRSRVASYERTLSEMRTAWATAGSELAPNVMLPAPAQQPHPPVWVGGNSSAARRRAVLHGDGWMPFAQDPTAAAHTGTPPLASIEDLAAMISELESLRVHAGRPYPLDVCFGPDRRASALHRPDASTEEALDEIGRYGEAGVTWLTVQPRAKTPADLERELDRLAEGRVRDDGPGRPMSSTAISPTDLRGSITDWLQEHGPDHADARFDHEPVAIEEVMAADLRLQQALWDAGFTRHGWPAFVGGTGGNAVLRAAVYEQLVLAGFRVSLAMLTVETLGPVMVQFSPELSERLLPACLRGDEVWCQGFSEPEAGSDLAALRCKAEVSGDHFVVSGQKLWSSLGSMSQRTAMLVRTGGAGHRGISMVVADLDAPGCEVRAIRASSGRNEFAELFFDDTPVGLDRVVGEVDRGWDVAMSLLQSERGMYAWQRQAILHSHLARAVAGAPDLTDIQAAAVADAWVRLCTLRASSGRTVGRLAAGENPGPEISVDKVLLSTTEQAVLDVHRLLAPLDFALSDGEGDELGRAEWFYSRMATIYGGALEIQRTIVAERVLGLPRPGAR